METIKIQLERAKEIKKEAVEEWDANGTECAQRTIDALEELIKKHELDSPLP